VEELEQDNAKPTTRNAELEADLRRRLTRGDFMVLVYDAGRRVATLVTKGT